MSGGVRRAERMATEPGEDEAHFHIIIGGVRRYTNEDALGIINCIVILLLLLH